VLDEAQSAPALVEALHQQAAVSLEVIVADGGSRDDGANACQRAGARIIDAPRGRARQMNAAVAVARGDWLLCLHADSGLVGPLQLRRALDAVHAEIGRLGHSRVAGHFPLRFRRDTAGHARLFRFIEAKSGSNRPGTINGDQGLLIRRDFFEALGGFDTRLPYLEDTRMARRIFAQGRWLLLPDALETSARRFETGGHYRVYALMALIQIMNEAGVDGFFEQAAGLYATQTELRRIDLRPYLNVAARALVAHPQRLALMRRIAANLAGNAWQAGLLISVLRS